MDTRYFGSNLLALDKNEAGRRRLWTKAEEEAYYREHTPEEHAASRGSGPLLPLRLASRPSACG